jgi:hypothetical protein
MSTSATVRDDDAPPDGDVPARGAAPRASPAVPPAGPFGLRRGPHWPLLYVIGAAILVLLVIAVVISATSSAPLAGRSDAGLDVISGVGVLTVHSGDLGSDLYRISTPDGSGQVPRVTDQNGTILLGFASVSPNDGSPSIVDVELSSRVTWRVRVSGGASRARLDLRGGPVDEVDLASGVSSVELWLPGPHGTDLVRETGGARDFAVHAPGGVPLRVSVEGGAGSAVIDGLTHSGIGGGTVYTPAGWDPATDRYDIDTVGGVSQIRVDRY